MSEYKTMETQLAEMERKLTDATSRITRLEDAVKAQDAIIFKMNGNRKTDTLAINLEINGSVDQQTLQAFADIHRAARVRNLI